jgi:ribosomal protein L25 (general stress protein Ctc)
VNRDELERALREAEPPDAGAARERARRTVLAAHRPVRRRPRLSLALAAVATALAALALSARDTGPARALERGMRSVFAAPAPTPAPAVLPGRLLVLDADGLALLRGGKRRALGPWRDATWSPRGLFVGVAAGRTLAAIEPDGTVRWRLRRPGRVADPRWAPGGLHLAYRAGGNLRIVYGNGTHDVVAGRRAAPVAPAWRPTEPRTVAWAATDGTVTVEDADTAKVLWRRGGPRVRQLAWSADGRRLLVNDTLHDLVTGARTRVRARGTVTAVAFGRRLARAAYAHGRSTVTVDGAAVLTAPGRVRDLEWSPDGRRLLVGWAGADHWLVVRGRDVAAVRHPFGAHARTRGWSPSP